uniref:Uncharacterized protein n=1 Tax=Oscillatoriales cyanobacterium SpSt-402 TaxID=2282168 RepID=A0A832H5L2_9CYAN
MKRVLAAVTSTLILSTLVAPGAKAIRPELLPQRVHPTFSTEAALNQETTQAPKMEKEQSSMQTQKPLQEVQKSTGSNELTFEQLEKAYKDKYGS